MIPYLETLHCISLCNSDKFTQKDLNKTNLFAFVYKRGLNPHLGIIHLVHLQNFQKS